MTQLLQQAIAELQKLPASEQDAIASLILAELTDEQHWDEQFAASESLFDKMAKKVRDDIRSGQTRERGMDEL